MSGSTPPSPPPPKLWESADSQGELVYYFNQSSANWGRDAFPAWMDTAGGYCMGLCALWIGLRLRGRDFEYDRQRKELGAGATTVAAVMQLTYKRELLSIQTVLDAITSGGLDTSQRRAYDAILGRMRLRAGEVQRNTKDGPDFGFLMDRATATRGVAVIGWRGDGAGHATALDARPAEGRFNYFDPNFGHYQFASYQRFHSWFIDYLKVSNYRTTHGGKMEYVVVGLL